MGDEYVETDHVKLLRATTRANRALQEAYNAASRQALLLGVQLDERERELERVKAERDDALANARFYQVERDALLAASESKVAPDSVTTPSSVEAGRMPPLVRYGDDT